MTKTCQICHRPVDACDPKIEHRVGDKPVNYSSLWLELIGTATKAKKLRPRLATLKPPVLDPEFGPEAAQCPTTVLFGYGESRKLYANPRYRPALDAWDNGMVSVEDLTTWCYWVERGNYTGAIYPF